MSEPSEAAMRVAADIVYNCDDVPPWECDRLRSMIAPALDSFAAAAREEAIKVVAIHGAFQGWSPKLLKTLADAIRKNSEV